MSSTGIVNFEDATIQAVEMYATEKLRIGVSSSTAKFAVGGDIEIGGNINVTGNIIQGSTIITSSGSSFNGANTLVLTNPTTGLTVDSNVLVDGNVTAGIFLGDGGLLSNISGGGSGIDTTQTLALTNPTTGLTISSNALITGNVTSDTIRASNVYINNVRLLASVGLQEVTNVSNTTSNTISLTNPTTGLTVSSNVGIGTSIPNYKLDVTGDVNFTGSLYQNGTIFSSSSAWTTSGSDIYYNTGNVGIGVTGPAYKLHVSGDIYATGNITELSDIRKKKNLQIIEAPIEKVNKLNGYTYEMDDKRYTGLVAQEVLKVLPEAVVGSEEKGYGLAYGNMVGLLVEALKEMNEQLQAEKAKVATVLARLDALENA